MVDHIGTPPLPPLSCLEISLIYKLYILNYFRERHLLQLQHTTEKPLFLFYSPYRILCSQTIQTILTNYRLIFFPQNLTTFIQLCEVYKQSVFPLHCKHKVIKLPMHYLFVVCRCAQFATFQIVLSSSSCIIKISLGLCPMIH